VPRPRGRSNLFDLLTASLVINNPREAIPQKHWKDFQIDYLTFLQDNVGETQNWQRETGYSDLWFDSAQVDQVCPERRTKLSFRFPIVGEKA
jgi:hypothetical protein